MLGSNNVATKEIPPSSVTDKASSFFSSAPMSQEMEPLPLLVVEEDYEPKENPPTPPDLGGAKNAATK